MMPRDKLPWSGPDGVRASLQKKKKKKKKKNKGPMEETQPSKMDKEKESSIQQSAQGEEGLAVTVEKESAAGHIVTTVTLSCPPEEVQLKIREGVEDQLPKFLVSSTTLPRRERAELLALLEDTAEELWPWEHSRMPLNDFMNALQDWFCWRFGVTLPTPVNPVPQPPTHSRSVPIHAPAPAPAPASSAPTTAPAPASSAPAPASSAPAPSAPASSAPTTAPAPPAPASSAPTTAPAPSAPASSAPATSSSFRSVPRFLKSLFSPSSASSPSQQSTQQALSSGRTNNVSSGAQKAIKVKPEDLEFPQEVWNEEVVMKRLRLAQTRSSYYPALYGERWNERIIEADDEAYKQYRKAMDLRKQRDKQLKEGKRAKIAKQLQAAMKTNNQMEAGEATSTQRLPSRLAATLREEALYREAQREKIFWDAWEFRWEEKRIRQEEANVLRRWEDQMQGHQKHGKVLSSSPSSSCAASNSSASTTKVMGGRPSLRIYGHDVIETMERNIMSEYEVQYFSFKRRGLHRIPPTLLVHFTDLIELNLSSNNITFLPNTIDRLYNLRKLYLNRNRIQRLPSELYALAQLRVLDLSYNILVGLSPEVASFQQLQVLSLSHNRLTKLPSEIGKLQALSALELDFNGIEELPREVSLLKKLSLLRLNHNPLMNVPPNVFQRGLRAILNHLRNDSTVVQTGKQLRDMAMHKDFSDATLCLGTHSFPAHKIVLVARCPSFKQLICFQESTSNEEPEQVIISGCERVDAFKCFLYFLYDDDADRLHKKINSKIEADIQKTANLEEGAEYWPFLDELLKLAKIYNVKRLEQACISASSPHVMISNSTFIEDFGNIFYKDASLLSDVSFLVEGRLIPAHKVFLAASSEYFRGMFLSGLREADEKVVPLFDIRYEVFMALLEYCYTSKIKDLNGDIAVELLMAACAYALPRLKCLVENLLCYGLDAENACCLWELARMYKCPILGPASISYITQNWSAVRASEGWNDLDNEHRQFLLRKHAKAVK